MPLISLYGLIIIEYGTDQPISYDPQGQQQML